MSVDKHFKDRGVKLTEDNSLPLGQRTQKNVKRIMAAVRAAESEFNDELRTAHAKCRFAQEQVIVLQDHVRVVENELKKYKLKERMQNIPALSVNDREQLLHEVKDESDEVQAA